MKENRRKVEKEEEKEEKDEKQVKEEEKETSVAKRNTKWMHCYSW